MAISGAPGGQAVPTPIQIRGRIYNFHVVAALIFAAIVGAGMWTVHNGAQLPEATVRSGNGRTILERLL